MYCRYNRYDSDDPDIDEEFIDESRAHKVKTTRRPLRSVLYYMKGNESTTALTPVQLPARSKILQASKGHKIYEIGRAVRKFVIEGMACQLPSR